MRLKGLVTLKKRKEFAHVRLCGRSVSSGGLLLQAAGDIETPPGTGLVRVGFTVSKKTGNSVIRNRVKRKLRVVAECVLARNANKEFCYVLVSSRRLATARFRALQDSLVVCLKRLGLHL